MSQIGQLERKADEEIKRILEHEHGFEFQGPLHDEAPTPKVEYIGENNRDVDRIRSYLVDMYIIRDPFGNDHSARREFINRFEREHKISFFHRRSKLKGNNNLAVLMCAEMIGDDVKRKNPNGYDHLKDIFPPRTGIFSDEIYSGMRQYNGMSFDEKVAFVRRLDSAAYRFLEALSK